MKFNPFLVLALGVVMTFSYDGCVCSQKCATTATVAALPSPQAIIYKTRKDYSKLVPVALSPDGKTVISYPGIKDIYHDGKLAYPTPLHDGFLLDNRGISANVAFINLTYEQYAALEKTPTPEDILNMIVDRKPVRKMYACGLRSKYVNIADELNTLIDKGDLSVFTRIK